MKLFPQGSKEWKKVLLRWALFAAILTALIMFTIRMPGRSHSGPLPPLSGEQALIRDNLRKHVSMLAGTIGRRNIYSPKRLSAAAGYIKKCFTEAGYSVTEQKFDAEDNQVSNLIMESGAGNSSAETVIIGAHYDTILESPGANDNASGVAALIELARLVSKTGPTGKRIRFVAFVNEEPPFFTEDKMGSLVYARELRGKNEKISAMFSLETIGCYSDEPGSQKYPAMFKLFYPDTGNFIGFIGNISSRSLVRRSIKTFRDATPFPSEGVATFGWLPGIFWSDHWSFWKNGYPALMVTDTAPFRYSHYHTAQDTPEKLDYDRMARVVSGLLHVILRESNTR